MCCRFSKYVHEILVAGGWSEGRRQTLDAVAPLPEQYTLFPKAEEALLEFANLTVGETRRGINFGATSVTFRPHDAAHLATNLKQYEPLLNVRLYPLGFIGDLHCALVVDDQGRIYFINSHLVRHARDIDHSLELILMGVRTDAVELAAGWGSEATPEIHLNAEAD